MNATVDDLRAIERLLGSLPKEKVAQLAKMPGVKDALEKGWLPNPGQQQLAFDSPADELFYGGTAGGGKALSVDELVVTPFGFRQMGSLKVGDTVCAADGTPTKVIGVFPQGVRPLYRVTFQDGVSVLADAEHRWNYAIARKGKWRKSGRDWKVGTTAQLSDFISAGLRPLIPLCEPLKFTKAYKTPQRNIDPYALGLLLGDGYTKQNGPGAKWSFTSADPELVKALPGEWVTDGAIGWRLRGAERPGLLAEFRRLGLAGCGAKTKFIPEPYKWAPASERLALLQGLMDTDGTNDGRGHASFCSISKQLADDVAWLVRSLGGRATITEKQTVGELAYNVYIRTEDSTSLFRLDRKRDRGTEYQHGKPKRRIDSITYECDGEAVCIAVDHPDSLYVVGDGCIVTHNTELMMGTALTAQKRSLILRRTYKEASRFIRRFGEIVGHRNGWSGQTNTFTFADGRIVEFGGCQLEDDKQKYKGEPKDFIGFDEISDFTETQYRFIIGWNRSASPGQRCRVIAAGNPPTTPEGLWVVRYWAPWLDETHPNPAKPGELRWFTTIAGEDTEVDGPGPHMIDGEPIIARSRTFIPARLEDNPDLAETNYGSVLASLPPGLREAYKDGKFSATLKDDDWQVIPTSWILAAQARWKEDGGKGLQMTAIGMDCAGGGKDAAVIAPRHGGWFAPLETVKGDITADGSAMAAVVVRHRRDSCPVVVDVGGGYSGAVIERFKDNNIHYSRFDGSGNSVGTAKGSGLKFHNKRAEAIWRFREELDPDQEGGSAIALPPDPELRADLASYHYTVGARGILIEPKEDIKKRIGRSPDKGDAVAICLSEGNKAAAKRATGGYGRRPQVQLGYSKSKR